MNKLLKTCTILFMTSFIGLGSFVLAMRADCDEIMDEFVDCWHCDCCRESDWDAIRADWEDMGCQYPG